MPVSLCLCVYVCAHDRVCACLCERRKGGQKLLQLSADRDKFSPSQGCCSHIGDIWRTNVCEVLSGTSDSCVQSAKEKLMGENEMSTRWGWGQYGTKIKEATNPHTALQGTKLSPTHNNPSLHISWLTMFIQYITTNNCVTLRARTIYRDCQY